MAQVILQLRSRELIVDTDPLPCPTQSERDKVLRQLDGEKLAIRRSVGVLFLALGFLILGGTCVVVSIVLAFTEPNYVGFLFVGGVGILFSIFGALVLLLPYHFDIDRGSGQLVIRRFGFSKQRPLNQILGIQLISGGWHEFPVDGPTYTAETYQLNLILDDSQVARLNLMHHTDWDSTLQAGQQLAEFLRVPLMNHVSEKTDRSADTVASQESCPPPSTR